MGINGAKERNLKDYQNKTCLRFAPAFSQRKFIHSLKLSTYKDLHDKSSLTVMREHSFPSAAIGLLYGELRYGGLQGLVSECRINGKEIRTLP
jgi:hypothetical protein